MYAKSLLNENRIFITLSGKFAILGHNNLLIYTIMDKTKKGDIFYGDMCYIQASRRPLWIYV